MPHVGEPVELVTHTVRLGESIASIALRYGMRREQLTLTLALALALTLTLLAIAVTLSLTQTHTLTCIPVLPWSLS